MRTVWACMFAIAMAAGAVRAQSTDDRNDITLTGCLLGGSGANDYLIFNLPSEPAGTFALNAAASDVPVPVGTSGAFSTVFYWLNGDVILRDHVGHQVEIEGQVKGKRRQGEIRLERKDAMIELDVKADRRSMKASVPMQLVAATYSPGNSRKMTTFVRQVDVSHVRMLAASCG